MYKLVFITVCTNLLHNSNTNLNIKWHAKLNYRTSYPTHQRVDLFNTYQIKDIYDQVHYTLLLDTYYLCMFLYIRFTFKDNLKAHNYYKLISLLTLYVYNIIVVN